MTLNEDHPLNELDQATSGRLARLRSMPVDVSRLDRALAGRVPMPAPRPRMWSKPLRMAIAASLLLVGILGAVLLMTAPGTVQASPAMMAQFHRDLVSERVPVMKVDSIEDAAQMLNAGAGLPDAPDAHVMACCMRDVKDRKMACVLLNSEGTPVTMTVARAADVKAPTGPSRQHQGATYYVHLIDELTMVTTQRGDRWVCLISPLPAERLMELAGKLQF